MVRAIVPFRRWHVEWLLSGEKSPYDIETLMQMEKQNSWTAVGDGKPVACGGTVLQWPGRSLAWTCMGPESGRHMRWLTREASRVLGAVRGRVEATVRRDFDLGHRWARMLGFAVETPVLEAYGPQGEDHVGYVRMNRG